MASLPDKLLDLDARTTSPASAQVKAWGSPAIILRCGVPRPPDLVVASSQTVFYITGGQAAGNSVLWLPANTDGQTDSTKPTVLTAIDRSVYIEVTLPPNQSSVPLPQVSDLIAAAFPTPVCYGQSNGSGPIVPDDQLCTHRP